MLKESNHSLPVVYNAKAGFHIVSPAAVEDCDNISGGGCDIAPGAWAMLLALLAVKGKGRARK